MLKLMTINTSSTLYKCTWSWHQGEDVSDLQIERYLPFNNSKIKETPDHHTLLILYVGKEGAKKITATDDDHFLARV